MPTPPHVHDDPLLAAWGGPHGGVPPFDRVRVERFVPAFAAAMAEKRREVRAIADAAAAPSFENTIAALERSGRALQRVTAIYDVYRTTLATPEVQRVEDVVAPQLAALGDEIAHDEALFARVSSVYAARATLGLTPEQQRLVWFHHTTMARGGAGLDGAAKARLTAIHQRLAVLFTTFAHHLQLDEAEHVLYVREDDLAGLPHRWRDAAAAAAAERGHRGEHAILCTRSSVEPFLAHAERRDLRERVWRTFTERGARGDRHDNRGILREILRLRHERARLLGFASHAHWQLADAMAKTPAAALALLELVWAPAGQRAREEIAEMQAIADAEAAAGAPRITIEPWDHRFYAEKVRQARYHLDQAEVAPYLQLERLLAAMFWVAERLFGLRFTPVDDVPTARPEIRVFAVRDGGGAHRGLFYFDPFARAGKDSGAWMNEYRCQERLDAAVTPIVSNNANFLPAEAGAAVLLSWDDARTLFHEFGHALHGLLSDVTYPSLAGTSVARDYVELPSQLLEHWLETPEVLARFARHVDTGAPMPAALVDRLRGASRFLQGFKTVEYLASARIDLALHLAAMEADEVDPAAVERTTLAALGMPRAIAPRHRPPHFAHVFASDAYAAAYYSYLWADTLSADAWAAFVDAGGPFAGDVARRLREHVLAAGNGVDPVEGYRAFRGRDAGVEALMRERGFTA